MADSVGIRVVISDDESNPHFVRLLITEAQSGRVSGLDEQSILNTLSQERSLATENTAPLADEKELIDYFPLNCISGVI